MSEVPLKTRIWAVVLATTAIVVIGSAAVSGVHWERNDLIVAAILGTMIVLVERFKIDFPHASFHLTMSVGAILSLAAGLTFEPVLAAVVVMVTALIGDVWDRLRPIQVIVNATNLGLATFCAAVAFQTVSGGSPSPLNSLQSMAATVVAAATYTMINTWGLAIIVAPVVGESAFKLWKSNFSFTYIFVALPAMGSLVPLVAKQHPLALLILLVPLVGSHLAQRTLRKVQDETQATMESLADALEVRDAYTHRHSVRVAQYVEAILDEMPHLPTSTRRMILDAARIHDLGKVGIRDTALLKAGPLTEAEFREIKRHSAIGAELVANLEIYRRSAPIIRHHHERWDGKGYPDGLQGEAIPLGARIIAVADSFDAMTTDRPYRRAMSVETALAEIKRNSGTQFDPQVVAAFERAMLKPASEPQRGQTETSINPSPAD